MNRVWIWRAFPLVGIAGAIALACGQGDGGSQFKPDSGTSGGATGGASGGATDGVTAGTSAPDFGGDSSADCVDGIVLTPGDTALDVAAGQTPATLTFAAKSGGVAVTPQFSVDRGEVGTIGVGDGVFTPRGTQGGKATVTARYKGCTATAVVTVKLSVTQNGAPAGYDAGVGGGGGVGGVGGEGLGGAVSGADGTALDGTAVDDPTTTWLYPYEATIFPRGTLPPLLQWRPTAGAAFTAVRIQLDSSTFHYDGRFARPTLPGTPTDFIRHPIPEDVWNAAVSSNEGDDLKVNVTLVASGGQAKHVAERKISVAHGPLKGTVYYNSYGTNLARNHTGAIGQPGGKFGGAVLAIKGGSKDPVLIAGSDGTDVNCRVCHSVASGGATLVSQWGDDNRKSSAYDLRSVTDAGAPESPLPTATLGIYAWPAISPDGTFLFSNAASGNTQNLPGSSSVLSQLYSLPSGASLASTGLPAGLQAGTPAFSKDGRKVAFNFYKMPAGDAGPAGDRRSLATMDFDPATKTFSNFQVLFTPSDPNAAALWPSFLPDNGAIVFELETRHNRSGEFATTRSDCEDPPAGGGWPNACHNNGARAELWYIDLATKTARPLQALNGKLSGTSYLPTGINCHGASPDTSASPCLSATGDDTTLQFEPTVNPVVSGGYAWVVFVSRRLYGNVATINPWHSDPRFRDISVNPTPKKLWVAALDLNPAPGADPSHPALYLPAQELLAGNSRGFWVVDPCKSEGGGCASGDECCGGYCRPASGGGALVCTSQQPVCAEEFEKCSADGDCCGVGSGVKCINQRCSRTVN